MKKKFALSFLTIASVALLAACGEVSTSGSNTTGNEIGKELKVGFNFEKTGEVAAYGSAEQKVLNWLLMKSTLRVELTVRRLLSQIKITNLKQLKQLLLQQTLSLNQK